MRVLGIDPSMYYVGWANYNGPDPADLESRDYHNLDLNCWQYGLIKPQGVSLVERWRDTVCKLECVITTPTDWLIAEWPMYFASTRGKIAATKGHTLGLAGMVGHISCRFGTQVVLWTPNQWKGSVPKSVTLGKFKRMFGKSGRAVANTATDDTIDAIMLVECFLDRWRRAHKDD
jgi:hypothetical protein